MKNYKDCKDYEVCTAEVPLSAFIGTILKGLGLRKGGGKSNAKKTGSRWEEETTVRTKKTERGIRRYYNRRGVEVLSITKCTRTKGQELPTI